MTTTPAILNINTIITNGIQIGANTHNQDQVITPVNFNAINKIANKPENPIPELVVDLLSDISLNLKFFTLTNWVNYPNAGNIGFEPMLRSNSILTTLFVAGVGFEPTYDQGYEPCELPVLYPTIYFFHCCNLNY